MSGLKNMIEKNRPSATREDIQKIIEAWLATPEGKSFYPSDYNLLILTESMFYDTTPMSVAKISKHYWKRRGQGAKFTKQEEQERVAKAQVQAAAVSAETKAAEALRIYNLPENIQAREDAARAEAHRKEEELLASFWIPIGNENSGQTHSRAMGMRHDYFAKKFGMNHLNSGFRK